jgi:hypothetical protein
VAVLQAVSELLSDPASLRRLSEERLRQAVPDAAVEGVTLESPEKEVKRREGELERQVEKALRAGVDVAVLQKVTGMFQGEIESLRAHQASLRRIKAEADAERRVVDQPAQPAEEGRRRCTISRSRNSTTSTTSSTCAPAWSR